MPTAQEIDFGKLVVEHKLATIEQVRECFAIQAQLPKPCHVGTLLVERGYLNQQYAHKLFEIQRQRAPAAPQAQAPMPSSAEDTALGQKILQYSLLSQQQLTEVFHEVQRLRASGHNITLSQRLIQRSLIRPEQLAGLQQAAPGSGLHPSYKPAGHLQSSQLQQSHGVSGSTAFTNPAEAPHVGSGTGPAPLSNAGLGAHPGFGTSPGSVAVADSASRALLPPSKTSAAHFNGRFKDNDPMARKLPTVRKPDGTIVLDFGDFEIIEEVARGGMGIVYKALHKGRNSIVALKAMKRGENSSEKQIRRFKQETEAANNLEHPNIVGVHDIGCHQGFHFYTMDLVGGGALDMRLKKGDFPEIRESASIVKEVALAIEHAHSKKIIHRDLKPANILFDLEDHAKVTDFGLAKNVDRKSMLTRTGAVVGTPYYMPPEQARGNTDIDARCDVYALGVILYELMTGKPPFRGETAMEIYQKILEEDPIPPTEKNKKIPRDLEVICLQAIAKKRERRYQSAKKLAEDLGRFLDGEAIKARPPGLIEKLTERASKHKTLVSISLGVLGLLLVLGSVLSFMFIKNANHKRAVTARKAWDETTSSLKTKLNKIRRSLDEAQSKMTSDAKLSELELQSAQKELSNLTDLIAKNRGVNRNSRIALLFLCLDPELRAQLIDGDKVRDKPETDKFLELAGPRFDLYGLPEAQDFRALSTEDIDDYLNFVKASAVNADPSEEAVKDYKIQNPFIKRDLPALYRSLFLEKGRLATTGGNLESFELASQHFQAALKYAFQSSYSQEIRLEIARTFARRKKFTEAINTYSGLLKDKSRGKIAVTAAYERGLLHAARGQLELAIKDLSAAIDNSFKPAAEYLARGRIYMKQKLFKEALADFSKLLNIKGDSFEGYLEQGRAYAALGRLEDAQGSFSEAIAKQEHPSAYYERGVISVKQLNHEIALQDLTQAIQKALTIFSNETLRKEELAKYHRVRSSIYKALKDPVKAQNDLTKARQYDP
jgi:serine/threonine protein kinase/Flp pilus assembly protein TadD